MELESMRTVMGENYRGSTRVANCNCIIYFNFNRQLSFNSKFNMKLTLKNLMLDSLSHPFAVTRLVSRVGASLVKYITYDIFGP